MNFKNLAVTAVAAALPFAFTQEAIAAPSDCWWGVSGVSLDHKQCDVERLQDDSGEYFEIVMGGGYGLGRVEIPCLDDFGVFGRATDAKVDVPNP